MYKDKIDYEILGKRRNSIGNKNEFFVSPSKRRNDTPDFNDENLLQEIT